MSFRTPIFIEAGLGKNAQPLEELFTRWNSYGETLRESTENHIPKIIVFLPKPIHISNFDKFVNLEIKFFPDSWMGRLKLLFEIRNQILRLQHRAVTLVAGDIYVTPVLASLSKIISHGSVKIQVQFHGATYVSTNRSFRANLKHLLIKLAIFSADSVRIVSAFQKDEIQKYFNSKNKEFVISPIPILMSKIPTTRTPHHGLKILVLGRLHAERGISTLTNLIQLFIKEDIKCTFNIIGDGPEKFLLIPYSRDNLVNTKVILHGTKNGAEIKNYLAQSDLLISFAEDEGYGLALREAILSGVHVFAKRNKGTEVLLVTYPDQIDLFESASDALKLIMSYTPKHFDSKKLTALRNTQAQKDTESVQNLIQSWIKI